MVGEFGLKGAVRLGECKMIPFGIANCLGLQVSSLLLNSI